jgi:hypothetical protein
MPPHIYVIHLKHRTDRKKKFLEAWTLPTRNLHWFTAVDGSKLSDTKLAAFRTVAKTRKARAGRVGCYCSHVAAIQKAIQMNHFPLLILEDDAVASAEVDLANLFADAPKDAALLYFGALPVKQRKRVTAKQYCSTHTGWRQPVDDVSLYGGHAYGFATKEAAQEIVSFLHDNKITFDSALLRFTKAYRSRVAVHCPFVFFQSDGFSDIEGVVRPARGGD